MPLIAAVAHLRLPLDPLLRLVPLRDAQRLLDVAQDQVHVLVKGLESHMFMVSVSSIIS